jgi:hypothetical protein
MIDDERYVDGGSDYRIHRRTVLKSAAVASAAGLVGVPAFAGSAAAQETGETLYLLDTDVNTTELYAVTIDDANMEAVTTYLT